MKARPPEQLLLVLDSAPSNDTRATARRVVCGSEVISYRLRRTRRQSIGLHIDETGLTVRAPRWITLRDIEAAIAEHQRWIRKKHVEWQTRRNEPPPEFVRLEDGGTVQFLGNPITLRLGVNVGHLDAKAGELRFALSPSASRSDVREALQLWLQQQARTIFADRIALFADRVDACFAGWRLSSAGTQWGSCSHDGRIRLNWRLVHFALPVIDYVIAHELAHVVELNHSPRFWRVVSHLLPGFETARDQIKRVELAAISF